MRAPLGSGTSGLLLRRTRLLLGEVPGEDAGPDKVAQRARAAASGPRGPTGARRPGSVKSGPRNSSMCRLNACGVTCAESPDGELAFSVRTLLLSSAGCVHLAYACSLTCML